MTRTLLLILVLSVSLPAAEPPEVRALADKVVRAAGGESKLLRLFRMKEKFHFGTAEEPPAGKNRSLRDSVLEPPRYWWLGSKERETIWGYDVWGWSLRPLVDPASQLSLLPAISENGRPALGIRVEKTVAPALDLYFDQESLRLVRLDWKNDTHRFSQWTEYAGFKYPSHCVSYRRKTGEPYFFHDIVSLEVLAELPPGLKR